MGLPDFVRKAFLFVSDAGLHAEANKKKADFREAEGRRMLAPPMRSPQVISFDHHR